MITRRNLLIGVSASLIAAPAIVQIGNIMPVRNRLILPGEIKEILFAFEDDESLWKATSTLDGWTLDGWTLERLQPWLPGCPLLKMTKPVKAIR